MKSFTAIIVVIVTMASAEPPYQPRGFRPSGPGFNLPLRSQKQQLPPTPAASYGPPPQEYGPPNEDITTTETPTTTESVGVTTSIPQQERLRLPEKVRDSPNGANIYVVVPQQNERLVLAEVVQQPRFVPIQEVPIFAKIQESPYRQQLTQIVEIVPTGSSAYTSIVNTPFSRSFVQNVQ
ncbi:hypothetical protein ABEB36_013915 [Hypothenemus hampei]|uniref:DUF4794 domain-containing protein n=1 Tax=Hypothenemus hampei TaxID=57062 RepID=A0ABD1E5N2_HYPHA